MIKCPIGRRRMIMECVSDLFFFGQSFSSKQKYSQLKRRSVTTRSDNQNSTAYYGLLFLEVYFSFIRFSCRWIAVAINTVVSIRSFEMWRDLELLPPVFRCLAKKQRNPQCRTWRNDERFFYNSTGH